MLFRIISKSNYMKNNPQLNQTVVYLNMLKVITRHNWIRYLNLRPNWLNFKNIKSKNKPINYIHQKRMSGQRLENCKIDWTNKNNIQQLQNGMLIQGIMWLMSTHFSLRIIPNNLKIKIMLWFQSILRRVLLINPET